jgi:hypothetical protein
LDFIESLSSSPENLSSWPTSVLNKFSQRAIWLQRTSQDPLLISHMAVCHLGTVWTISCLPSTSPGVLRAAWLGSRLSLGISLHSRHCPVWEVQMASSMEDNRVSPQNYKDTHSCVCSNLTFGYLYSWWAYEVVHCSSV